MASIERYRLELLVKAPTWDEVVSLMATLGINEKQKASDREINGMYVISISLAEDKLTNEFYNLIEGNELISIVSDQASEERLQKAIKEICRVETKLRKLLLHVNDLVEPFYEVLKEKGKYSKKLAENQELSSSGSLDPITSYLTLGEMLDILQVDLSWSGKALTPENLIFLLEKTSDLPHAKRKLEEKMQHTSIWEVVEKHVLVKDAPWKEIAGALSTIKSYRDRIAHFRVITPADSKEITKQVRHVLSRIDKEKTPSQAAKNTIADLLPAVRAIASTIETYNESLMATAATLQTIQGNLTPAIDTLAGFRASIAELPKISNMLPSVYPGIVLGAPPVISGPPQNPIKNSGAKPDSGENSRSS